LGEYGANLEDKMKKSRLMQLGVGALMVSGAAGMLLTQNGMGVSVAYAQTGTPPAPSTQTTTPPQQDGTNEMLNAFWNALATKLGLSVTDLKADVIQAQKDTLAQAVTAGTLTQAQADAIEQRLGTEPQLAPFLGGFRGGPGGPGSHGNGAPQNGAPGMRGGFIGNLDQLSAVATALKLKPADLSAQLQSGKTLADIAKAQNVDETIVKQAIVDAAKAQIQREVEYGVLTQAQADQRLSTLTVDRIDLTHLGGFEGKGRGPQNQAAPQSN